MKLRALHRIYAFLTAHFWLECPACGQMFGGHEWRDIDGKPSTLQHPNGTGVAICPDCTRDGVGDRGHLVFWKDLP